MPKTLTVTVILRLNLIIFDHQTSEWNVKQISFCRGLFPRILWFSIGITAKRTHIESFTEYSVRPSELIAGYSSIEATSFTWVRFFSVQQIIFAIAQTHNTYCDTIYSFWLKWQHGVCDRCIKSQFCVINMNKVIRRTQRFPFITEREKKIDNSFAQLTRCIKVKRHTNLIPDSKNSNGFHEFGVDISACYFIVRRQWKLTVRNVNTIVCTLLNVFGKMEIGTKHSEISFGIDFSFLTSESTHSNEATCLIL